MEVARIFVRTIVRTFYETELVVIIDALVRHSAYVLLWLCPGCRVYRRACRSSALNISPSPLFFTLANHDPFHPAAAFVNYPLPQTYSSRYTCCSGLQRTVQNYPVASWTVKRGGVGINVCNSSSSLVVPLLEAQALFLLRGMWQRQTLAMPSCHLSSSLCPNSIANSLLRSMYILSPSAHTATHGKNRGTAVATQL